MSAKPHDSRWSHSTAELAEASTPPPPDSSASSRRDKTLYAGSVRSSQYSGTEEDGDKTTVGTSHEERKILVSSGDTARNTRFALHQAALSTIQNSLDADPEPATVDLANTGEELKAVISSGRQQSKEGEGGI